MQGLFCNTVKSDDDSDASQPDARAHFAEVQPQRVQFVVPGQPVGKGRARSAAQRAGDRILIRHYTPEKTKSYEEAVAMHAHVAMAGRPLLTGALAVALYIRMQVPASWSKKKRDAALAGLLWPTTKPDVDNIIKSIYDGCNGVCWVDDAQLCSGAQIKRYSADPGVTVVIEELV